MQLGPPRIRVDQQGPAAVWCRRYQRVQTGLGVVFPGAEVAELGVGVVEAAGIAEEGRSVRRVAQDIAEGVSDPPFYLVRFPFLLPSAVPFRRKVIQTIQTLLTSITHIPIHFYS